MDNVSDMVVWLRPPRWLGAAAWPISPLASQLQVTEPQGVANDRYGAQRHGGTGNHWAEQQPEHRIQHASGDRDTDGVIDEREEEVLADVPHGAPAETPSPGDATQVSLDKGHASAFHRHIRACPHGNPDMRLRQGWRVVDAIPGHRHHMAF